MLIEDILESINRIFDYTAGLEKGAFLSDRKTIDAVVRNLEVIGEASKRLSVSAKSHAPATEWNQITGLRNRVIHEYFGVDSEIIWEIITRDLLSLRSQIEKLQKTLNP